MEIHPPHSSINSAKDFFVHLSMIVLGILIALSLEGTVEWAHHRGLAREARVNLAAEISDNQRRTVEALQRLDASEQQLHQMLAAIHALQANRRAPIGDLNLEWPVTHVEETSWNSAINTGAISYMKFPEVQRYTKLYALQRAYMAAHDRGVESMAQVARLGMLLDNDPQKLRDRQLEQAEDAVTMALSNARTIGQVGQALTAEYVKFGEGTQLDHAVTAPK